MVPLLPFAVNEILFIAATASSISSCPSVASIEISVLSGSATPPYTRTEFSTFTCGPLISIDPNDVATGALTVKSSPDSSFTSPIELMDEIKANVPSAATSIFPEDAATASIIRLSASRIEMSYGKGKSAE